MKNYVFRIFTRKKHLVVLTDDTVPWAASWRCCQHSHPILQEYFSELFFKGCIRAALKQRRITEDTGSESVQLGEVMFLFVHNTWAS
jgi:hypothetical protein